MTLKGKVVDMNGGRLIALLVLSLIMGLAGADLYAQDAVLLAQELASQVEPEPA